MITKMSEGYIFTLKEDPSEAEIASHKLLIRGGYVRKVSQGIFVYGPLFLRSLHKFEHIVRTELNKRSCIEVLMPMVHPSHLWEESGRWDQMGASLLKFQNRSGQKYCLGPTHEEVIVDYVRDQLSSYKDLPKNLYQIQTKYRDEIRPRFGLLRGREFIMKDAYSFDVNEEEAKKSYEKMFSAYTAIFEKLNIKFRCVSADSGDIGGDYSQEFHILAQRGESHLMVSSEGSFAANVEVCPVACKKQTDPKEALEEKQEFATPGVKTISDLVKTFGFSDKKLVKSLFYYVKQENVKQEKQAICVLLRGCDELNLVKFKNTLSSSIEPEPLSAGDIKNLTGAFPGSCGPIGLKMPVYMDQEVSLLANYVVGANKSGWHIKKCKPRS